MQHILVNRIQDVEAGTVIFKLQDTVQRGIVFTKENKKWLLFSNNPDTGILEITEDLDIEVLDHYTEVSANFVRLVLLHFGYSIKSGRILVKEIDHLQIEAKILYEDESKVRLRYWNKNTSLYLTTEVFYFNELKDQEDKLVYNARRM